MSDNQPDFDVAIRRLTMQLRNGSPRQQYFRLTRQEAKAIIEHVDHKEK